MRIIVLDTETTGIPEKDPLARIIEVGAVSVIWTGDRLELGSTFESLCNPGRLFYDRPGCWKALEVNGLSAEDIRQAPPSYHVGLELRRWVKAQDADALVAYGNDFDFDPLLLGAPEWLAAALCQIPLAPCIRTCARLKKGLDVYERGYGLSQIMSDFSIAREGDAHAALSDAIGAARLLPFVYPPDLQLEPADRPCTTVPFTRAMLRR